MLIRHKIILWFVCLSGLLLCLFSVYIYIASDNSRNALFRDRLKNKALATRQIYKLHDKVAERIITSIPEQSEYVFGGNNKLIFAINDLKDFRFNASFFQDVEEKNEFFFQYTPVGKRYYKEGYAFTFTHENQKHTIVITAYDKNGSEQLENLGTILIVGNFFFLIFIGLSAYVLSRNVLRPIHDLVVQTESVKGHDLRFRLQYSNPDNEIGIVAQAFNKILEKIQSLAESQKTFVSYASHELRTPLTAVAGILETSLSYDNDVDAANRSARAAQHEIQKAIGLVNGLLQLAKVDSIAEMPEKQRINIVELLLDSIAMFRVSQPDQEFSIMIDENIRSDDYIEIQGNAHLFRTAITNLIDNASKYSHRKKIDINVVSTSGEEVRILVIDRGIGISEEDLKYVHNPFFRGANAFGINGFGLGLALTQRIVMLHGGSLALSTNDFGGITATVILQANINES